MPLSFTGSLITVAGLGVTPSASTDAPASVGPIPPVATVTPATGPTLGPTLGGFLDFSGGLSIGPPAPPAPPDPVNTVTDEPPVIIGGPVTASSAGSVFAFWNTRGDLRSQISGGLWTGEAPATVVAMPYAVLIQVSDVLMSRTTGPKVFAGHYQISVMADNLTAADSLCRSVSAAYDQATLALDGFMSCLAGDVRWMLGKGLGLNGDDCWISYVELQVMYTR